MELKKYIGSRIRAIRKSRGLEMEDLAEMLNTTKQAVSRYELGDRKANQDILFELSRILNVCIDDFFPEPDNRIVNETETTHTTNKSFKYPYYPVTVAAGLPTNVDGITDNDIEHIEIPDSIMGKHAGSTDIFLLRANGESMNNVIPNGSLMAIKSINLLNLNDGDIVVYSDGNDYSVKRFYKDDIRLIFRPDSKDASFYDYITDINNSNLKIHGKVVVYIVELD